MAEQIEEVQTKYWTETREDAIRQMRLVARQPSASAVSIVLSIPIMVVGAFYESWCGMFDNSIAEKAQKDPYWSLKTLEERTCFVCGYNLKAHIANPELDARCPECGLEFERTLIVHSVHFAAATSALRRFGKTNGGVWSLIAALRPSCLL